MGYSKSDGSSRFTYVLFVIFAMAFIIFTFTCLSSKRTYTEGFFDSACTPLVRELNCSQNWQCIDSTPMRIKSNGNIECLASNGQCVTGTNEGCMSFIATQNDPQLMMRSTINDAISTLTCTNECGDPNSKCAKGFAELPIVNNCVPAKQSTISW